MSLFLMNTVDAGCTITAPANPASYDYDMSSGPYSWTVAAYTLTPTGGDDASSCAGYTQTLTMTKSDDSAVPTWISISGTTITVNKQILTSDHNASTAFKVTNTMSNGATDTNADYAFTIVLKDPCKAATLVAPTVGQLDVTDGSSATVTFADAADSFGALMFNTFACGVRTFAVVKRSDDSALSWVTVAASASNPTQYVITAAPTSTDTELIGTMEAKLTITASSDYSSDQTATSANFDIVVSAPSCTCAEQPFADGTLATVDAPFKDTPEQTDYTLVKPSPTATAYSATPGMRACAANACATTGDFTALTLADGTALPGWISWTSSTVAVAISPNSNSLVGQSYTLKAVFTPTAGSNTPTYNIVTITVTCEITSFTTSTVPGDQTYNVFEGKKIVDLNAVTYTQVPNCGYVATPDITVTSTPASSFITKGTIVTPSIEIDTDSGSDATTSAIVVSIATEMTITSAGQTDTDISVTAYTINVNVVNPCIAATVADITFSPAGSQNINDGDTQEYTFTIPSDTVDDANTVKDLCGVKTYTVKDGSDTITTWASIAPHASTARTYVLTIDSKQYSSHFTSDVSKSLTIQTRMADWATNSGSDTTLAFTFVAVACSCDALAWTAPTIVTDSVAIGASITPTLNPPNPDTSARTTNQAFDNCYQDSGTCPTTGSYTSAAVFQYSTPGGSYANLPTWITFATSTLTVAPTDPAVVGTYYIAATYGPTNGVAAQFQILTITVVCEVTSYTLPSAPTTGLTQYIKGAPITFDFTNSWVQVPNCGYAYTSSFAWTDATQSFMTTDGGKLSVQAYDTALNTNTYTVSVKNTITMASNGPSGATTFTPGVSDKVEFTVTLSDGCATASLRNPTISNINVNDGLTTTQTFTDASDTFGYSISDLDFCGTRTFQVQTQSGSTPVSWATVAVNPSNADEYIITVAPVSTASELQTTHNVKLVITAPVAYTSQQTATEVNFDIIVGAPSCDCTQQPWTQATKATLDAPFTDTATDTTHTLTDPTPTADAYGSTPGMRACAASACSTAGTYATPTLADDSALPGWIAWNSGTNTLTVSPDSNALMASNPWSIKVVFTPTEGSNNPTYTALDITVTCEVTSITTASAPTGSSYDVFDPKTTFSLTGITYTQVPNCGYAMSKAYTITTSPSSSFITLGTVVQPSLDVHTSTGSDAGSKTVTLATAVTFASGIGQTTLSIDAATIDITVTIVNPCLTATIDDITFASSSLTVVDGATTTTTFSIPQDTVDKANTIQDLCGTKVYTIKDASTTVTTWASIALNPSVARQYILTIDSTQLAYSASDISKTLTIETTFADWGANAGNTNSQVTLTVTNVACDCSALAWTAPTVVTDTVAIDASSTPTVNAPNSDTSATASNQAFASCYENSGTCPTTGSYAAITDFQYRVLGGTYAALPAWITYPGSVLTVAPTDPTLVGTYEIAATYTPTNGVAAQFLVVTLTVKCEVTSWTKPANPTSGLTQYIKGAPIEFDFTESWVQSPACGYAYTSSFTWTGNTESFMTTTGGKLSVQSYDTSLNGQTYAITVTNAITMASNGPAGQTSWTAAQTGNTVTFTVALSNGCATATINSPSLSQISVEDGKTQTQSFTDASDSFGVQLSDLTFCGARSYQILKRSDSTAVSWVTVALNPSVANQYIITASPSSTNSEMVATHELKMVISAHSDYSSDQTPVSVNFDVVVGTPTCDCTYQPWADATKATLNAPLTDTPTGTDHILTDPAPTAGALTANPVMRACSASDCTDVTGTYATPTLADDSALPAWISWASGTSTLTVSPNSNTLMASNPWQIKVAFTPTQGSNNPTYIALDITVTCEVTSITTANAPSTTNYNVFDAKTVVDLTGITFTQVPNCGYTTTSVYTITSSPASSFITLGTVISPSAEVYSASGADEGTKTVTLATAVTFAAGQGQTDVDIDAATIDFTIEVANPCKTTAIDDIVFADTNISVNDGASTTTTFSIPQDAVDKANTVQDLCGAKVYTVKDGGSTVTDWVTIAANPAVARQYIVTIDTS